MTFPLYLPFPGHPLHPHIVLETIGYAAGFQLYRVTRSRFPSARTTLEQTILVLVGAILGALFGSKLLAILESLPDYWQHRADPATWISGKTIVGGLLGGWIGVEIAKRAAHIRHSTGDAFVFPLILGMAIGRVGCFLTGLSDHTHGLPTSLPWAVDFGDGIPRHPTQLYDIAFLVLLAITLLIRLRKPLSNGQLFRLFLGSYLNWRFCVEFIKPTWKPYLGLSAIQLASLIGAVAILVPLVKSWHPTASEEPRLNLNVP